MRLRKLMSCRLGVWWTSSWPMQGPSGTSKVWLQILVLVVVACQSYDHTLRTYLKAYDETR